MQQSLVNAYEDGEWRYSNFESFVWDNIAETCLSATERSALNGKSRTQLIAAAKNLRLAENDADIGRGSELAEIVLYGIMRHHYGALPVVPKIFYKQNPQDNAKGADSVHVVIHNEEDFSLWFGEAKFYVSIEDDRLIKVIKSVGEALGTDKIKKENSIITNVGDLASLIPDPVMRKSIVDALSHKKSIDDLKSRIHIPILLLYQCQITESCNRMSKEYRDKIISYHVGRANSYFSKQLKFLENSIFAYESINFHLILFPVPNKEKIVDAFVQEAAFYKGKK